MGLKNNEFSNPSFYPLVENLFVRRKEREKRETEKANLKASHLEEYQQLSKKYKCIHEKMDKERKREQQGEGHKKKEGKRKRERKGGTTKTSNGKKQQLLLTPMEKRKKRRRRKMSFQEQI